MTDLYQSQRAMRHMRRAAMQRGVIAILDVGTSKIACLVLRFDGFEPDRDADGVGPMAGQAHHFLKYAPQMDPPQVLPYAQDRYRREVARLYGVLDRQLQGRAFVTGEDLTIADIAIWPWAMGWEGQQQTLEDKPDLKRWLETLAARPAFQRGRAVAAEARQPVMDKQALETLFKR